MVEGRAYLRSSIGRKVVMAVTGVILFGFVLGHMIGNLQVYLGPGGLQRLRGVPARVPARLRRSGSRAIGLLVARHPAHLGGASLTLDEPARRGRWATREQEWRESTYASRTMRWSGVAPPRLHRLPPAALHVRQRAPDFVRGRRLPQLRRRLPELAGLGLYIVAMLAARPAPVPRRLEHAPDARRLSHPRYNAMAQHAARAIFAAVVVLGNISFPLAVLAGVLR